MPIRSPSAPLLARALLACALILSALIPNAAAGVGTTPASGPTCSETGLEEPTRLSVALGAGVSTGTVRTQNGLTRAEVTHLAEDRSTWVDECGQVFVVDRAVPGSQQDVPSELPAQALPADVFDLSSRPESQRTLYLDFDGATYSGTHWSDGDEVDTIVSPAYSIDADRTTFSETERAQIYLAWQVVAEDFAPFDVNVTTRPPADASALTRTSSADLTYGMPVVITPTNSVGSGCGCGGVAYVGVFDVVGNTEYQPAWVFTNGSGTGGYNMGQVISHEAGHTFDLYHDGTSQASYYTGANGWAPIMGASYNRRASQWSSGEYPDADNTQDDVSIIAVMAPALADDHAADAAGATPIGSGTTTSGLITSRTDSDAFGFSASGATTLVVDGPSGVSDLDVQVTILDAFGTMVATIDPTAATASDESMGAVWTANLPTAAASYIAVVDGTGSGNPAEVGHYSDFGSLGAYTVSLTTQSTPTPIPTPTPTETPTATPADTPTATPTDTPTATTSPSHDAEKMAFSTTRLPRARAGERYRAVIRFTGPVRQARLDRRLPRGLTWRVRGGAIVIRGTVARPTVSRFVAVLSGEGPSVRLRFRLVVR